jgi:hypothetical protein
MEKIMSKTNDTSYGAAATSEQTRELTSDELDQVAGGTPNVTVNGGPLAFVAPLMGSLSSILVHEPVHAK